MFQSYPILLQRALSLSLMGSLLLSFNACQNSSVGQLRFHVAIANKASFAIQAIPSETDSLRIEVTGEGLSAPMTHTLSISKGQTTYSHQFSLPVGEKEVKVSAYQGETILAQGKGSASISANQSTPLTLVLKPVEAEIKGTLLTVQGIMPVDIPLSIKITGDGLSEPLSPKITLPAGVNSSIEITDTRLPPGKKNLELRFSTPNSDLGDKLPTISQSFTVSESENTEIILNLEALLQKYRDQLKDIPEFLALLRQYAPQLLALLGPTTPIASATPTPSASVAPGNNGQIQIGDLIRARELLRPIPTASPMAETAFVAEARLAFQRPEPNSAPFAAGAQENLLTLADQGEYTLSQNQIWGVLVRTRQLFETNANPPEYMLQIKKASGEPVTPLVRGTLNRQVTTPSGIYRGGFMPFTELSENLSLEAESTYTVEWVIFSPGTTQDLRSRYTFKTP